jgi:dTDP-4-amino-4,6-dideoxygalactose transaminase
LKYLAEWTAQRQMIASWYQEALKDVGDLILPSVASDATHVFHLYVIRTSNRDSLQEMLTANGIGTLIHYPVPPHLQDAYTHLGYQKGDFPLAEEIAETCLSLPLWPGMEQKHIELVSAVIQRYFK